VHKPECTSQAPGVWTRRDRGTLDTLLEQVEKRLIALALKLTQNNHTRAAELLSIWRPRLLRRMEKLGFKAEEE
jgi:transcriptional regulator with PAS, ATPase and Fis domain